MHTCRCNVAMSERPRQDVSDKFCWWCSQCKTRKSIREGSFFQKSRMTLLDRARAPPPSQITIAHARLEHALERLAHGWRENEAVSDPSATLDSVSLSSSSDVAPTTTSCFERDAPTQQVR